MIPLNAKIFIAGHLGMVGSAILKKYQQKGYSQLLVKSHEELDLLNQQEVDVFFYKERPDYVILAAAKVGGIQDNINHQADFLYNNLQIQNNVIWSAHKYTVKKLLFLGSSCIYPRKCPQPMKEEYMQEGKVEQTNEGYALAKIAGITLCEKIYEQFNQVFLSCIPTNVYGYNDHFFEKNAHVIPSIISKVYRATKNNDESVIIWGTGRSRREFLFVDDLADAVYMLMENYSDNKPINVGTGKDITIKELAEMIKAMIGYKGNLYFDATKPDGMPQKLLDIKVITALGWKHKTELADGLAKTYEQFLKKYKNDSCS